MAREFFLLQYDMDDEPNNIVCTSFDLNDKRTKCHVIDNVTAVDIYEMLSGKQIWKHEEMDHEQTDQ